MITDDPEPSDWGRRGGVLAPDATMSCLTGSCNRSQDAAFSPPLSRLCRQAVAATIFVTLLSTTPAGLPLGELPLAGPSDASCECGSGPAPRQEERRPGVDSDQERLVEVGHVAEQDAPFFATCNGEVDGSVPPSCNSKCLLEPSSRHFWFWKKLCMIIGQIVICNFWEWNPVNAEYQPL